MYPLFMQTVGNLPNGNLLVLAGIILSVLLVINPDFRKKIFSFFKSKTEAVINTVDNSKANFNTLAMSFKAVKDHVDIVGTEEEQKAFNKIASLVLTEVEEYE